jgi:hypothetical protein
VFLPYDQTERYDKKEDVNLDLDAKGPEHRQRPTHRIAHINHPPYCRLPRQPTGLSAEQLYPNRTDRPSQSG